MRDILLVFYGLVGNVLRGCRSKIGLGSLCQAFFFITAIVLRAVVTYGGRTRVEFHELSFGSLSFYVSKFGGFFGKTRVKLIFFDLHILAWTYQVYLGYFKVGIDEVYQNLDLWPWIG